MQRVFIPGSEWLYFKIYTGFKSADSILIDHLLPMAEKLKNDAVIDNFFFIRYADPQFHIRFRFHVGDVINYGLIFKLFSATLNKLVVDNQISKIECSTYVREIERYGSDYFVEIEDIFSIDSHRILKMLKLSQENPSPDEDRWRLALVLLDDMMNSFGYTIEQKFRLTKLMAENYKREFGFVGSGSIKQLDDKYRGKRKNIEIILKERGTILNLYEDELAARRIEIESRAKVITLDTESTSSLIYSLIHMTINRLFRSKNRLNELVICDFLQRFYDSEIAKTKYHKTIKNV